MFISGSNDSGASFKGAVNGLQYVSTVEEGNALVKRLKQLEHENGMLASTLSKLCTENTKISAQLVQLQEKCAALASAPLSSSSVLQSLFEPEKNGWFASSKSAAREKLEQLLEELKNEFVQYQATHTSSNEEVHALIGELQNAHLTAQNISAIVKEQQEVLSHGPLAVTVRVVSKKTEEENISIADLRRELAHCEEREKGLRQELNRAHEELQSFRAGGAARLEVERLREALETEKRLRGVKESESIALSQQIGELERQLRKATLTETTALMQNDGDSELWKEIERLETSLEKMRKEKEHEIDTLKVTITELEDKLRQSVPQKYFDNIQGENRRLLQELELASTRVKELERSLESESAKNTGGSGGGSGAREVGFSTLDDNRILTTLERNNERITRLESQRDKLIEESKQLRDVIQAKEEELIRISRATQEDKQRINFLLKRCVAVTDELNRVTTEKDTITEKYENAQLEINKLRRQGEELVELNQRIDEFKKKNDSLQARIAGVKEIEEHLIKAKETIAFMELDQSCSINMSQYAELQSKNAMLENTLEPIKKQLEDTQKKLDLLIEENESLHTVLSRQQNAIKSYEEKEAVLEANENKLREGANQLISENARLQEVNNTLEKQMTDMQDGIKEMAVKMEQERAKAFASAEMTYKGELEQLQAKLQTANETLESVRLAQHSFVPEGIHNAVVAEKDSLIAEIKQKTCELEKLKSEILIYRQTIQDLEYENEENVHQIELLQSEHQRERSAAGDRLSMELKKLSDVNTELEQLQLHVQDLRMCKEKLTAQYKAMEETAQRNQRAFEEKCCVEEKLLATVTATKEEMERQREELSRVRTIAEQKGSQLEEEIAALSEKLQRSCAEKEALERELAELQQAMGDRSFENNACGSNIDGDVNNHAGDEGVAVKMSSDAAAQYAREEELLMSLTQTQCQLKEQEKCNIEAADSFRKILETAHAEVAQLRQRVQQLENELDKQATVTIGTSNGSTKAHKKKNKKSVKEILSVIGEPSDMQTADVSPLAVAVGAGVQQEKENEEDEQKEQKRHKKKQRQLNELLEKLQMELLVLRDDNAQLREEIVVLQQELQMARDKLEHSGKESKKKCSELQEKISCLEAQLRKATNDARKDTQPPDSPFFQARRPQVKLEEIMGSSDNTAGNLNEVVKQLQLEVEELTRELLPTKNKLIEYMAVADRLGIQYPFSAEMEGAAVLRLKALHFDSRTGRTRAVSAPRLHGDNLLGGNVSLDSESKRTKKRRHKLGRQTDKTADLR